MRLLIIHLERCAANCVFRGHAVFYTVFSLLYDFFYKYEIQKRFLEIRKNFSKGLSVVLSR